MPGVFWGWFGKQGTNSGVFKQGFVQNSDVGPSVIPNSSIYEGNMEFTPSLVIPIAHEFRPASIAALACITY